MTDTKLTKLQQRTMAVMRKRKTWWTYKQLALSLEIHESSASIALRTLHAKSLLTRELIGGDEPPWWKYRVI